MTLINLETLYCFQFIIKGYDTMNIQMEEMCKARYVGRGTGLPQPGWAYHFPRMSMCSPTWKLSEPLSFWTFVKTSLHRHD